MSSRSWRGFVRLAVPLGLLGLLWYFAFDYDPGLPVRLVLLVLVLALPPSLYSIGSGWLLDVDEGEIEGRRQCGFGAVRAYRDWAQN